MAMAFAMAGAPADLVAEASGEGDADASPRQRGSSDRVVGLSLSTSDGLTTNFRSIQYIQSARQAILACRLRIRWNMRGSRDVASSAGRARHPHLGRLS